MECEKFLFWISEYIDGSLTPEIHAELEKHLGVCPRCKSIANTLKATITLFHDVEFCKLPASIHQSLHQALRYEWETHKVKVKSWGYPPAETIEEKTAFLVLIQLPGVKKEDVNLTVTKHVLKISGINRATAGIYYLNEINYSRFSRKIELPQAIDTAKVESCLENGILRVKLPKL